MFYIYILKCDDQSFYVGLTRDLERRILQHQSRQSLHTKRCTKVEFVYAEPYEDRVDAEIREQQLKGWSKAKKEALINGDNDKLVKLSKSKSWVGEG